MYSNLTSTMYANIHCAMCNSEGEEYLEYLQLEVICTVPENYTNAPFSSSTRDNKLEFDIRYKSIHVPYPDNCSPNLNSFRLRVLNIKASYLTEDEVLDHLQLLVISGSGLSCFCTFVQ